VNKINRLLQYDGKQHTAQGDDYGEYFAFREKRSKLLILHKEHPKN
jgi:hypothetical protein